MSEASESKPEQESAVVSSEKVGDILRKERVTRRITVETVAKDLKLNAGYIKAIESNKYEDLPPNPYIRVYVRSLAKYLMLNPDEILKKFYDESGLLVAEGPSDRSGKLEVNVKEPEKAQIPWHIVAPIFIVLVILLIIAGRFSHPATTTTGSVSDTLAAPVAAAAAPAIATPVDSGVAPEIIPDEEQVLAPKGEEEPIDTDTAMNIVFTVKVLRDSVWVQAFTDGVSWRNYLKPNTPRTFRARDSINIHIGNNAIVSYTLNGAAITMKNRGVAIFKIDKKGAITEWKLPRWNAVFKGRLD
jgi:transcriptional regulator with XRE-family HTH domain